MTTDSRTVYLNGKYVPLSEAHISVMDRGFLFGDGVYEVIPIFYERLFRPHQHLQRLQKSLDAIQIEFKIEEEELLTVFQELLQRNHSQGPHQSIYLQITRGASHTREHVFPDNVPPTLFIQCTPLNQVNPEKLEKGGKVITTEDIRWQWCYIKAITLLPNVLFAQKAKQMGVDEVIWTRDGFALEGCSSNLFIVKDGTLITPPLSPNILGGITRDLVLELAEQNAIVTAQKNISINELLDADEVWVTGSLKEILPVTMVNDDSVGNGQVGQLWHKMKQWYEDAKINW